MLHFEPLTEVLETDRVLVAALTKLDSETFIHCKRVKKLALFLGQRMSLTSRELGQLRLGALLHDIGKKDISANILKKKTPLTRTEWELIELHPIFGWNCVAFTEIDEAVKRIIANHHRWMNGEGGYPNCHEKFEPCILTQITTVADVVDAMISTRAYRPALSLTTCIEYLEKNAGIKFNPDVVKIFGTMAYKELANLRGV